MIPALAWAAASIAFLVVHAWLRPDARARRAYRRSIAAQRVLCRCGCGHPLHKHTPVRLLPRQRRATEES
ncbi:hypothetical protein ACFC26_15930 [Kitasatospora purpeofusca]|uniref:hypothetical protein n=1 Tax=Kitasatospora purpeofusca TaxID=67352 RepID=UPI0035E37B60